MDRNFTKFSYGPRYRVATAVIALAAIFAIGGCAFTTGHVDLSYQPSGDATKVAQADSPPVAVQVSDKRPTQVVGQKINGFGMKTADIVADTDVPGTIKNAFETELSDRGFTAGPNGNQVAVTLDSLQNSFTVGFFSGEATATAGMDVAVKRPNGTTAFDQYFTGNSKDWIELATPENAETMLDAAIKDAITKVFADQTFLDALKKS